ncbi:MAG: type I DNA topoisomerase [Pseudomonadota bacterium]
MNLVIVESPAKAKTIKKYLGADFEVLASYGHVRDLVPKEGAVDPVQGFAMRYQAIERNDRHVRAIAQKLSKAETLYLATDPDREGEAISWHLYELLKERKQLRNKTVHRVVFNEVTRKAVRDAVASPRELSMELVNAQQARRALDYLVGFNLSPLLWKKVRRGLSAGRVQSPALRLIVEREAEITAFQPREYWTVTADTTKAEQPFSAKLIQLAGEKISQFSITQEVQATAAETAITQAAQGQLLVQQITKKQRKRNPAAPFTTSTLQQEAARKLGFTTQRTMRVAQQLYEGIDIGSGAVGLITYMRTDSVNLSNEATAELRDHITQTYGADHVPKQPRRYRTKAKNAQEAHEAIRPTTIAHQPDELKTYLKPEQLKLYALIWKRTVACQMIHATIDTVAADLQAGEGNLFRANGSVIANPGFMQVYQEGTDDAKPADDNDRRLPALEEGERLPLLAIRPEQHFTEPPPRYSEASLVKTLEEHGIGRPSTYASIISTLQDRDYAELEKKRFQPTDVGQVVNRFLSNHFTQYVDYDFTARLENDLDAVARGEEDWVPLLERFWQPFIERVQHTDLNVTRSDVTQEKIDEQCPKCEQALSIRLGRNGRFIGCTGYPECDYTRNLNEDAAAKQAEPEKVGRDCPKCASTLVYKQGRYGKFIGCSGYPTCRHIEPLEKPKQTGVTCPKCSAGELLQRKSRRGKIFYSCATYPACDYATWNEPVAETCPECSWPVLTIKTTKRRGREKICPQSECQFAAPCPESD